VVLVDAEANVDVDLTAIHALEELRETLSERGVAFALARVKSELRETLARAGFVDRIGEHLLFITLPTAVAAYNERYAARHGSEPRYRKFEVRFAHSASALIRIAWRLNSGPLERRPVSKGAVDVVNYRRLPPECPFPRDSARYV
jgi:hypothetical protein